MKNLVYSLLLAVSFIATSAQAQDHLEDRDLFILMSTYMPTSAPLFGASYSSIVFSDMTDATTAGISGVTTRSEGDLTQDERRQILDLRDDSIKYLAGERPSTTFMNFSDELKLRNEDITDEQVASYVIAVSTSLK